VTDGREEETGIVGAVCAGRLDRLGAPECRSRFGEVGMGRVVMLNGAIESVNGRRETKEVVVECCGGLGEMCP
jgi:hypothetical protein